VYMCVCMECELRVCMCGWLCEMRVRCVCMHVCMAVFVDVLSAAS